MASSLNNKTVIVTGSSSGIGESIAISLAAQGARVTLSGRDQDRLNTVLEKVVKASGGHRDRFVIVQGDLTIKSIREEVISRTIEKFGSLDVLVANAGLNIANNSISNATEESFDAVLSVNLKAVFFLIQEAIPHLEKSKGNIVNISSSLTGRVAPHTTVYSLSKVAIDHLTKCLAVDLGPKGIRVNAVNPGFFPTRIMRYTDQASISKYLEETLGKTPLKGHVGTVEDITKAVTFVASDAAAFITGEIIYVDGGRRFN